MADEDELKRQLVLEAERDKKIRQEIEDAEKLAQVCPFQSFSILLPQKNLPIAQWRAQTSSGGRGTPDMDVRGFTEAESAELLIVSSAQNRHEALDTSQCRGGPQDVPSQGRSEQEDALRGEVR